MFDETVKKNQGPVKLSDLSFMDLYLRIDQPGQARYRTPVRDHTNNWTRPVPPEYMEEVEKVASLLRGQIENPDTSFEYGGQRFRLSYQRLANSEDWVCLRYINTKVPRLEDLSFAPHICTHLRRLGTRDGLIVISGATGQGKTTTAFGLLNDFMVAFGGVGITVEDPVEYALGGAVGEYGYCYQVQVNKDEDWASPLKRALRWTPRFLLVGEVRSPRAAEQILRASTTGHLVITTIHAGSIEESLMGLVHLAEQAMGASTANFLLAQGLTGAMHQTLNTSGPFLRYIVTEEGNNGDPIRALIRENRVGMINSYIDKQIARMNTIQSNNTLSKPPKKAY
ncbi:MAG: GspE family protein [Alphaproteobacteria bacterium]|nr:GspE family protein [Alphaproteobacteria bacterium]